MLRRFLFGRGHRDEHHAMWSRLNRSGKSAVDLNSIDNFQKTGDLLCCKSGLPSQNRRAHRLFRS
jgi:hypothetical protein